MVVYVFVTTASFPLFTPTPATFSHPLFQRVKYPPSTALSGALNPDSVSWGQCDLGQVTYLL